MALAHTIKDKAQDAYRRGKLLKKRRRLMEQWRIMFLETKNLVSLERMWLLSEELAADDIGQYRNNLPGCVRGNDLYNEI